MSHIDADRILETSVTTGAGNIVLAGPVTGYRAISSAPGLADGDTVDLYIEDVFPATGVPTGAWECGTYTWRTGGLLERTQIRGSSNGGAPVAWGAGMRRVGLGLLAYMIEAIRAVNGALSDVEVVAGIAAEVSAAANNVDEIVSVAGSIDDVTAVAGDIASVNAVASHASQVDVVAGNVGAVQTVAQNIALIQSAPATAQTASDAAAAASTSALTAVAQASLASVFALSAASVAQQDLSGVSLAALHRSPNPIIAVQYGDVTRDRDPNWPDRCQHLSYANEPLSGAWLLNDERALNGIADELHARCIGSGVGAETITDPSFDTGAWSTGAGATISGGKLTLVASGVNCIATMTTPLAVSTIYRIKIVIESAGATLIFNSGAGASVVLSGFAPGTYIFYKAGTATTAPRFLSGSTGVILECSVKPVTAISTNAGDYFNQSTDGKHYRLNAGYVLAGALPGITETTRGNTAKHPRQWMDVAEGQRVVRYDLTQPGRPMWMVLVATAVMNWWSSSATVTSIASGQGRLVIGSTTSGIRVVDFAADRFYASSTSAVAMHPSVNIANRHIAVAPWTGGPGYVLPSSAVNAVSMCVMLDAPVDPVTGLQAPTIAVGSNGGASVIKHDGSVVSSASTSITQSISITPKLLTCKATSSNVFFVTDPGTAGAGFAFTGQITQGAAPGFQGVSGVSTMSREVLAHRGLWLALMPPGAGGSPRLCGMRLNEATPAASLTFGIGPDYNTGWMAGSTVRCLLADTATGAVAAGELAQDRTYKGKPSTASGTGLTRTPVATAAQLVFWGGWSATSYLQEAYSADLDFASGMSVSFWGTIPAGVAAAGWAVDRSAATGPYWRVGHDAAGKIVGEVFDGTTTRTVTSPAAYNNGQPLTGRMELSSTGTLMLVVNGRQVAQTTGGALATLANAVAVFTIGQRRALDAPWAGGLALVKVAGAALGAVATAWAYDQERQMFRDGAQVALPDALGLGDAVYDAMENSVTVNSATGKSKFIGLIRVDKETPSAGSFSRASQGRGVKALARSGANPGVDITVPPQSLREEILRGAEEVAARARQISPPADFDFAAAQTDLAAPPGWEWHRLSLAGIGQREGASKQWQRLFDGFTETARFNSPPGANAWVQGELRRMAA